MQGPVHMIRDALHGREFQPRQIHRCTPPRLIIQHPRGNVTLPFPGFSLVIPARMRYNSGKLCFGNYLVCRRGKWGGTGRSDYEERRYRKGHDPGPGAPAAGRLCHPRGPGQRPPGRLFHGGHGGGGPVCGLRGTFRRGHRRTAPIRHAVLRRGLRLRRSGAAQPAGGRPGQGPPAHHRDPVHPGAPGRHIVRDFGDRVLPGDARPAEHAPGGPGRRQGLYGHLLLRHGLYLRL